MINREEAPTRRQLLLVLTNLGMTDPTDALQIDMCSLRRKCRSSQARATARHAIFKYARHLKMHLDRGYGLGIAWQPLCSLDMAKAEGDGNPKFSSLGKW